MNEVFQPECGVFGSVAYDQERGYIYATEQTAGPWGKTIVHVWAVKLTASQAGAIFLPLLLTQ